MEAKKNCSTIFLLPGIGLYRRDILKFGFLSAFIDDENHEVHYKDAVYLLFKPEDMSVFQEFVKSETYHNPSLIGDYDYARGYVVLVYRFPEEFAQEYKLFFEGKYSEFSRKYIDLFPQEILLEDTEGKRLEFTLQYHIFGRTAAIKRYWEEKIGQDIPEDMEMWSRPDIRKETLNINNI